MYDKNITIIQKNRIIEHFPILIDLYNSITSSMFRVAYDGFVFEDYVVLNLYTASKLNLLYSTKYKRIWAIIKKIVSANQQKRFRVRKKILNLFSNAIYPVYFGTMTFTDYYLDNLSSKTRRVYVGRFIKSISDDYLANIDFGDLKHREHFHCIFSCENKNLFSNWNFGFVNVKQARFTKKDLSRMSKYLVKLFNHFTKDSAGYLISSRCNDSYNRLSDKCSLSSDCYDVIKDIFT